MAMAEGLEVSGPPPPVCDRYYTKYYATDHKPKNDCCDGDQCVLRHSNRVCVVCLAPSHALLTNPDLEIVSIDFHIGNVDRQDNKVSGKRKNKFYSSALAMAIRKGAQKLMPTSPLCVVHCKSDVDYCLYSCIKGCLIEMNEHLLSDPTLLQRQPKGEGYIAILLTKLEDADTACNKLLTEDEYKDYLANKN